MNLEKMNMAQWESVLVVGGQQFAQIGHYFTIWKNHKKWHAIPQFAFNLKIAMMQDFPLSAIKIVQGETLLCSKISILQEMTGSWLINHQLRQSSKEIH